jgi:hypothetical protein
MLKSLVQMGVMQVVLSQVSSSSSDLLLLLDVPSLMDVSLLLLLFKVDFPWLGKFGCVDAARVAQMKKFRCVFFLNAFEVRKLIL